MGLWFGVSTRRVRGGSIVSPRAITPLLPASIMQTAGMSPSSSWARGRSPRIWVAKFFAATCAIRPVGEPAFGMPSGVDVCQGAGTAAAAPTA